MMPETLEDQGAMMRLAIASTAFAGHLRALMPVPDETRDRFDAALEVVEVEITQHGFDPVADYPGCLVLVEVARCVALLPRERRSSAALGMALDGAAGLVMKRVRSIHAQDKPQQWQERADLK